MHILSYSHAYMGSGHNGGAETTLHDLMRLARLDGHKTTALLSKSHPDGSGSYVLDGVKVQAHSSKRDPDLYFPTADLIVSHLECASRTGLLARDLKKPSVHLLHNEQDYCVTAATKYASAMIFNTEWIKPHYPTMRLPHATLHPPVDPQRYKVDTTREYITIVNLTIGTTDRLSYDKGGLTFYEMARRFPDQKFLGVKGGYGDQYVPDDLPSNVTILEHTNNILDVYRRTKVLLVPSKYESYGRVMVEGACSGIPSVVTRTDGTVEAMGYQTTYAEYGNYDLWEKQLDFVLSTYEYNCKVAYERALFNWNRTLSEWEDVRRLFRTLTGR